MTEKTESKIRSVYKICLTALTLFVGVLFIIQLWRVYFSAEKSPYSVESISKHFKEIAIPVWLWIVAVIGGGVLWCIFPENACRPKAYTNLQTTLCRLQGRLPQGDLHCVSKESRLRWILKIVAAGICLLCAIVSFAYLLDSAYSGKLANGLVNKNHAEAEKLLLALPWIAVAFACIIGVSVYETYSLKKEIHSVKTQIAENAKKAVKGAAQRTQSSVIEKLCNKIPFFTSKYWAIGVRATLLALSLVLIVVGIVNGGMHEVWVKAVNICKQCIGLG